jgi:hypothetical protein
VYGACTQAIVGSSSGNLVEWYDFYCYAFFALYRRGSTRQEAGIGASVKATDTMRSGDAEAKLRDEFASAFPLSCVGHSLRTPRPRMRPYTMKEKLKITAGAVTSLVIVGWAVVLAIVFMSAL